MNKIFMFAASLILCACSETIEDKAEAVIEKDMQKTLVKPDTYSADETVVDSAFAPLDDAEVFNMILKIAGENVSLNTIETKVAEIKENMANAKQNMLFIEKQNGSKQSETYKKYQAYYDEYDKILNEIEPKKTEISERIADEVKDVTKALLAERKFIGYKVVHKYTARNNEGSQLTDSCFYLIDKNMNNVLFSFPLNKYRVLRQSLEMIGTAINQNDSI